MTTTQVNLQAIQPPPAARRLYTGCGVGRMDEGSYRLFLKNCAIIQENEVLRKRSEELAQENKALLEELIQKLSKHEQPDLERGASSSTTNLCNESGNNDDGEKKKKK